MSNIIGNRNSTPETSSASMSGASLRPPASRAVGSGHHLRASADMGAFSTSSSVGSTTTTASQLANRGIRPASEVYLSQMQSGAHAAGSAADEAEKAAQQWIADIDQYENTLEDMAAATLDQDFKDELSAIEAWFRVLSEPERTAALYALLQQTTQVQVRFFIQVLQQMAKSHPVPGVLSPTAFAEKDPMAARMTDAMNKLQVEGSRHSFGFGSHKPPPSPGAKRMSGLDPTTIKSMFPDAANAIEDFKEDFRKATGNAPKSNRNSAVGDRSSLVRHEDEGKKNGASGGIPPGSWRNQSVSNTNTTSAASNSANNENSTPIGRPKSSSSQQPQSQQPMGQFGLSQPPPSSGLRGARGFPLSSGDSNIQSQAIAANESNAHALGGMPLMTPFPPGASWASMTSTPMVANFNHAQQNHAHAEQVANATAMKLAALSTVSNRIQLDDARKFRRARSQEGAPGLSQQHPQGPMSPGIAANIAFTNEHGHLLSPQQAAVLQQQQQQLAALQGRRSRPSSPGIAITGPAGMHPGMSGIGMAPPQQANGFLSAFDQNLALSNGMAAMNLAGGNYHPLAAAGLVGGIGGIGVGGMGGMAGVGGAGGAGPDGYLSDASEMHHRGRSPRGRRGSSKPPEDPTDPALLRDIANWLRTLRLHKYTENFQDMKWQDMVLLDEEGLEAKGVAAKGARTKLLKVFKQVREAQSEGKL